MKCSLFMIAGAILGISFCMYAMESGKEQQPLLASATLKEVDEAWAKHDNALINATNLTYYLWLSKQPTYKFTASEDANEIDLTNKNLITLSALFGNNYSTIFHTNPIAVLHIHTIDVSDNELSELPLQYITNLCSCLQKFKAQRNNVSYVSMYGYNTQRCLTEIDLSHNKFTDIDLTDLLNAYPALKTVRLSHNPLKTVTWDGSWERTDASYPDIYLDNTQLSIEESQKVVEMYKSTLTSSLQCGIGLAASVGTVLGIFVGIVAGSIKKGPPNRGEYTSEQSAIMAEASLGAAATGGTLAGLATYLCVRPRLQQLKKEAEQHVIFDDLQEVG